MNDLKLKIKHTALFTPEEKIEILAAVDTFSDSDKTQLEIIIDEYDQQFSQITATFKQNMIAELDAIEKNTSNADAARMHEAVEKIKSGLSVVASTPTTS